MGRVEAEEREYKNEEGIGEWKEDEEINAGGRRKGEVLPSSTMRAVVTASAPPVNSIECSPAALLVSVSDRNMARNSNLREAKDLDVTVSKRSKLSPNVCIS